MEPNFWPARDNHASAIDHGNTGEITQNLNVWRLDLLVYVVRIFQFSSVVSIKTFFFVVHF